MIWYLLYPFRGTTEAPVLGPSHPLRSTFTRCGVYTARHVVTTLLVSVAVAAILSYPIPFLYTNDFTNGASNLPRHVWTDAQPLHNTSLVEPDIIMRSIWVHGSYMKALDHQVLLGALELQDQLLGPLKDFDPRQSRNVSRHLDDSSTDLSPDIRDAFHVANGLTNESWFFHSPLQYWSCDAQRIAQDADIVFTVNEKKTQPTSVNVTLRHSVVFSGKRFADRALVAADALVITLLHLRDSPVAVQWERRAAELAERVADKWTIYPSDGRSQSSQLYEFQFRPISGQDSVVLALAYALATGYFLISLSKLRAIKSKPGLIITVLSQILAAITSSFTICAIFKIDLSKIPRAAYPLVVLSMSMENMFRLINAVLLTRSEDSTPHRIGEAFGQTAPIAAASVLQNMLILWGFSKVVSDGVSAFCAFAAIAMAFDFFYLSTFFLSVLSVEVRRTELCDALEKSSTRRSGAHQRTHSRQSWFDAMLQGNVALSTRIATTIIMIGFVLMAQWHFFEKESVYRIFLAPFRSIWGDTASSGIRNTSPLVDIHQARSPTSWLRMQDHETAKEVIHVVKPNDAHQYVARVYDPVVFVLRGSDRMPSVAERSLLPAVYDFAHHQWLPLVVTVLVIMAAIRILMNYLLWEESHDHHSELDPDEEPGLTVQTLGGHHSLDVAMLSASTDGQLVSVGLDRIVRVWDLRVPPRSCTIAGTERAPSIPFPVLALALDHDAHWLAILAADAMLLWSLTDQKWVASMDVDLRGQRPEAFFFTQTKEDGAFALVIVKRDGTLVELHPDTKQTTHHVVCKSSLASAVPIEVAGRSSARPMTADSTSAAASQHGHTSTMLVAASRRGCLHRVARDTIDWVSEEVHLPATDDQGLLHVTPLPAFGAYMLMRSRSVDLVDLDSSRVLHTFSTEQMQPRSLKVAYSAKRLPLSNTPVVLCLTLAYNSIEGGEDCVIQTYVPPQEGASIAVSDEFTPAPERVAWSDAREIKRRVPNPGSWETLSDGVVVGVRRKTAGPRSRASSTESPYSSASLATRTGSLRQRGKTSVPDHPSGLGDAADTWEAWSLSQLDKDGWEYRTTPLVAGDVSTTSKYASSSMFSAPGGRSSGSHLLISELGPMVKVGPSTVAVGFGHLVKLVTVGGHARYGLHLDLLDADPAAVGSRVSRRKRPVMGGGGSFRGQISSKM